MKFKNHTFEGQNVLLDGNEFIDCTFKNCKIEYRGFAGFNLESNSVTNCSWIMGNPAANAINYLAALYAQGGDARKLVEGTFENIRTGKISPTKH